jgi:hypothetical protein
MTVVTFNPSPSGLPRYLHGDGKYRWAAEVGGGNGNAAYSPYVIEIVQPQAGLDTKNRFYRQYTGLEYNVKVAVFGGDFSHLVYSLTTAPSGMTINAATGVISWPNPIEAGSPHTVAVSVTDGLSSDAVSWTLTVNTANHIFVDSTAVTSGNGSIGSPFKLFTDYYLSTEANATYQDYFVYYRSGTHLINSNANTANGGAQWGTQKPVVHMAYPGESVTMDAGTAYIFADATCNNFYWEGFTHINVGNHAANGQEGVWVARLWGDNITVRKNIFADINNITGSNNQAYIMATDISPGFNDYWSFSENDCDGSSANAYALVTYSCNKLVVESNKISNVGNIGIGVKHINKFVAVRGNWGEGANRLYWLYNESGIGDFEVSWNYGNTTAGQSFMYNGVLGLLTNPVHIIRNTFLDSLYYRQVQSGDTMIYETDNVIVSVDALGHTTEFGIDESRITKSGNLINASETNFVSSVTGLLTDSYVGQNATKGANTYAGLK